MIHDRPTPEELAELSANYNHGSCSCRGVKATSECDWCHHYYKTLDRLETNDARSSDAQ